MGEVMKMGNEKLPIRCFEGTMAPHEPFWKIVDAASDDQDPEIQFDGYISEYSWFEDDITPKKFREDLYALGKNGPVTIRLNSPGGDVIAASVIRAIIMDYPGKVTVRIDGLAASAATVVATAGDRVVMQDTAFFMIHDPMAVFFRATLNIEELTRMVDTLKSVKNGIVGAYQTKTGMSVDRLSRMMTEETWMSAQEAVDYGFADKIVKSGKKNKKPEAMGQTAFVNALKNYVNVPAALCQPVTTPAAQDADARRLRAEVQILKVEEGDEK